MWEWNFQEWTYGLILAMDICRGDHFVLFTFLLLALAEKYALGTENWIFWWQARILHLSWIKFSILTTERSLPSIYYNLCNGAVAHNLTVRVCLQTSHSDWLQSLTKVTPNSWTPFVKTYKTMPQSIYFYLFFLANSVIMWWRNICR